MPTIIYNREFRLTAAPTMQDMERLNQTADLIGARRRFLVSNTATSAGTGERVSCNLDGLLGFWGGEGP